MIKYSEFAPTQFDTKGLNLPDQQNWLVLPVSVNRDTADPVTLSNWNVAQTILDEHDAIYDVHSFNHWGPGWFEIILVHPDDEGTAQTIEDSLADYPVLDDEDHSQREHDMWTDEYNSFWRGEILDELRRSNMLAEFIHDIDFPNDDEAKFDAWINERMNEVGVYPEFTSEGSRIDVKRLVESITIRDIIGLTRDGSIVLDWLDDDSESDFRFTYGNEFEHFDMLDRESDGQTRLFDR